MRRLMRKLVLEDRGQDLAEYGIALAIIAGFVVAVAVGIAGNVQTLWTNAQSNIDSVVTSEP